jgi:hypothetical protein
MVLPDLHTRVDLIRAALEYVVSPGTRLLDALEQGSAALVFLGDGLHSEAEGAQARWRAALREYRGGFEESPFMDAEMRAGISAMRLVWRLKAAYPRNVHFIRGNHENILNEDSGGMHPFFKFALEGAMVRDWVERRYGKELLMEWAGFEAALPLAVVAGRALLSHAEPARRFSAAELIEGGPDAVDGLAWTENGASLPGSAEAMLDDFFPGDSGARFIVGHRPTPSRFSLRAGGRVVQIHNPLAAQGALLRANAAFEPGRDIVALPGPESLIRSS